MYLNPCSYRADRGLHNYGATHRSKRAARLQLWGYTDIGGWLLYNYGVTHRYRGTATRVSGFSGMGIVEWWNGCMCCIKYILGESLHQSSGTLHDLESMLLSISPFPHFLISRSWFYKYPAFLVSRVVGGWVK